MMLWGGLYPMAVILRTHKAHLSFTPINNNFTSVTTQTEIYSVSSDNSTLKEEVMEKKTKKMWCATRERGSKRAPAYAKQADILMRCSILIMQDVFTHAGNHEADLQSCRHLNVSRSTCKWFAKSLSHTESVRK